MSKRLRASMRAANKGRNLRPRNSQPHAPVATPSQPPAEAAEALAPVTMGGDPPYPPAQPAQPLPSNPPPSADLRARETEREPAAAVRIPSAPPPAPDEDELGDEGPEADALAAAATEPAEAEPAEAEPAGSEPAEAEAAAPEAAPTVADAAPPSDTQPSSPGIEEKEVAAATGTEVPLKSEPFNLSAPKPAAQTNPLAETLRTERPKAEELKKVEEPKKAAPKAEEPKKAAPKAEEPKKVEEPKKAAPKVEEAKKATPKVEEPKKAAPKVEEPKKAAPKAEDPKSVPSKKTGRVESEPASRKPASLRAVHESTSKAFDDDLDASSISAEFFRKDQDSVPPIEEHDEPEEVAAGPVLTPSMLARRARLRRMVAGVVACFSVIAIAVVGKQVFASKRPQAPLAVMETKPAPVPTAAPAPAATQKPAAEPQKVAAAEPAKVEAPKADDKKAEEPKADDKKAEEAKADDKKADDKKADEKKADDKKADEAKKDETPAPSGADADALRKETLSLLNRGKSKDAIDKAKELIAADPADANGYLYLGSALQDTGHWKDGIEAYCECVRHATKGPINECRAVGGHK